MLRASIVSAAILAGAVTAAAAGDATGVWVRDDGAAKVRIAPCGAETLCGSIVWLKEAGGPAKIGEQVFFGMKPKGDNLWTGSAFNPEDGKKYSGKLTLSGDSLITAGCVLGGLICKSESWVRSR